LAGRDELLRNFFLGRFCVESFAKSVASIFERLKQGSNQSKSCCAFGPFWIIKQKNTIPQSHPQFLLVKVPLLDAASCQTAEIPVSAVFLL
jgi:hypothetical protein